MRRIRKLIAPVADGLFPGLVAGSVFEADRTDDFPRNTRSQDVGRDVRGRHASRAGGGAISDRNT